MQRTERPIPASLLGDVLWTRRDRIGLEHCRVLELPDFYAVQGTVLSALDDAPYRVDYLVHCDLGWRTATVYVQTNRGNTAQSLEIGRTDATGWMRNGVQMPDYDGLLDIDLGITPSTNLLPIRRLNLEIGEEVSVDAVWIDFPDLRIERLPQRYLRTGEHTYRYESVEGAFMAELEVDDQGIMVRYGDVWDRVVP